MGNSRFTKGERSIGTENGFHFLNLDGLLEKLEQVERIFPQALTTKMNQVGDKMVANIQRNTPVDTGDLRHSIHRAPVEKAGSNYKLRVTSNLHYVLPVEKGRRTRGGGFRRGAHMFEIGTQQTKQGLQNELSQFIQNQLGGLS
nr:HK97 gp10 family phage protein [Brevibacillus laterosporus]